MAPHIKADCRWRSILIVTLAFIPVCMWANPLYQGADPDVLLVGDTVWLYATAEDGHARHFYAYASQDLQEWTRHGPVFEFDSASWIPEDKKAWAPGVIAKDGRYYLYYSCGPKPSSIGVAVSDHPAGPFVDSGQPLLQDHGRKGFEAIDAHVFEDPATGRVYGYAGGSAGKKLRVFEMNDDLVSFAREVPVETPPHFTEAPFMIAAHGRYHFTYSHGSYRDASYSVHYATAPSPVGPWRYEGVLLRSDEKHKGPGHHALLQRPGDGETFIFYHRYNNQDGRGPYTVPRQIAVDRVTWTDGGRLRPVRMTDHAPRW